MRTVNDKRFDFSGGVQSGSNWLLRAANEVEDITNGRLNDEVGRIIRRLGYSALSTVVTGKPGLGLFEAKFSTGSKIFAATNKSDDTETQIRVRNSDGTWGLLVMPTPLSAATEINMCTSLDDAYIAGKSAGNASGARMRIVNVKNDLSVSETRNLLTAPRARFVCEYGGRLHAMNVEIGGNIYPDRDYLSSPALSAITYVRGAQSDVLAPQTLLDNVPAMTSNSTPSGVASASGEANNLNQAYMAFDDNIGFESGTNHYKWTSNTTTGWLRYFFGSGNGKVITYYSVMSTNSASAPKNWTFEGSNDGTAWDVLDTRTNETGWGTETKRTYPISNTTSYTYYRINISANNGDSNYVGIMEMELLTSGSVTKPLLLNVDTVRYIKSGMQLDIYRKSTTTKLATLTVADVNKVDDNFTFLPFSYTIAAANVNTTNDTITLPDTTNFQTGQQIKFDSSASVPGGLTADTVYYAIRVSATVIKVAVNADNANLGNAIDLTSTGSGNIRVRISYTFGDNDEIYLMGRYGQLYYLWNTDYPTVDKADFVKIPSGAAANSEIIGWAKSNNRLFLYTETTMHRFDQAQLVPIFEDIGCANHQTIRNIGDWVVWLDAQKRINARNDSTGQWEIISRSIKKKYLRDVPLTNLATAAAGVLDNQYKICLGQVNGKTLRLVYDFDANNWTRDEYIREMRRHITSNFDGVNSIYFLTDNGRFCQDEIGNTDDGDAIPLIVRFGRQHYGTSNDKNLIGMYVYGENMSSGDVRIYTNGDKNNPTSIGQLDDNISLLTPGQKDIHGRDLNIEVVIQSPGDPPAIDGFEIELNVQEDKFDGTH